ncbi:MAG: DNA translocase FtsK 4TM domain-containing protein, partial [Bacteroidales bacterium]|nr:DNA translocase FtsK 4TM domain-containing protein [Bacteroidales bacterium]
MKIRKPAVLSEDNAILLKTVCGIAVAILAVSTAIALTSYIFTWKADQSYVLSGVGEAGNIAAGFGARWAHFLVGRCFGFGAIAVALFLFRLALGLLFPSKYSRFVRYTLVLFSGAVLSSMILAFIGRVFNAGSILDGGLGGRCGDALVSVISGATGDIVTFLILCFFAIVWLIFASSSFADWLSGKSRRMREEAEGEEGASRRRRSRSSEEKVVEDELSVDPEPAPVPAAKPDDVFDNILDGFYGPSAPAPAPTPAPSPGTGLYDHSEEEVGDGVTVVAEGKQTEATSENTPDMTVDGWEGFGNLKGRELPRYEPRSELEKYQFPPLRLLHDYSEFQNQISDEEQERNKNRIIETLRQFKVEVSSVMAIQGPTVTLYKLYLAPGIRFAQVKNLEENIGMALAAEKGVRVVKLADSAGIEVPNDNPSVVPLKALLSDDSYKNSKAELPVAIGYTISRKVKTFDLAEAPHLLVAGATKQGKSVGLNVIITSLLYSKHPSELKLIFIDPKMVEFSAYKNLHKHYLAVLPNATCEEDEKNNAIVVDQKKAEEILLSLCIEMDERYKLLNKAGVNNVKSYNEKFKNRYLRPDEGHRYLPYIVSVVDEFADLIMSQGLGLEARKSAEKLKSAIIRIAQKGRAAG